MKSIRDFKGGNSSGEQRVPPSADKYAGMSQNELMGELMDQVAAAQSNGTFSVEQLNEFVEFVSPSLDDASRERLKNLVAMIVNK